MGNLYSRNGKDRGKKVDQRQSQSDEQGLTDEEIVLNILKDQLNNRPEEFILNHLLASFHFFGNFEREWSVKQSAPQIETGEATLNAKISFLNKRALLPDRLQEAVLRRVRYRSITNGKATEALHPLRTLLVCEDVEVDDLPDDKSREYISVPDTPLYRVTTESATHRGFLKLKKIEIIQKQYPSSPRSDQTISFNTTGINDKKITCNGSVTANDRMSDKKLVGIMKTTNNIAPTYANANANAQNNESDYAYTTIAQLTKPKLLVELTATDSLQNNSLESIPESCIAKVEAKKLKYGTPQPNEKQDNQLYETIEYLNSVAFAEYFAKIFAPNLSSALGYRMETIDAAMTRLDAAAIFCKQMDITHKIMPTVSSKWPRCADEWMERSRKLAEGQVNGRNDIWPTRTMIHHVHSLDCQLIPSGFIAKRGINPERHLEWRATFPEAERYLLSTLQHSQVRCYQFTLILFRKLLETTFTEMDGIEEHLRSHLFWQCELEPEHWQWREDRLGEVLLRILRVYYRRLQKRELPDYFVRQRNLFESIPSDRLNLIASQLYHAIERPTVYMIAALVHMQYRDSNFYPVLDLQKLYAILTENVYMMMNPQMANDYRPNRQKLGLEHNLTEGTDEIESSITELKGAAFLNRTDESQIWSRQARKLMEMAEVEAQKLKELSTKRKQQIDLEFKVRTLDEERRGLLLTFFIPHFIEIAQRSKEFGVMRQALLYLQQAKRLTQLLSEELPIWFDDVKKYNETISETEKIIKSAISAKCGSKLPERPESSTDSSSSKCSTPKQSKRDTSLDNKINRVNSVLANQSALPVNKSVFVAEVHPQNTHIQQTNRRNENNLAYLNSFQQSPLYRSAKD